MNLLSFFSSRNFLSVHSSKFPCKSLPVSKKLHVKCKWVNKIVAVVVVVVVVAERTWGVVPGS